MAQNTLERWEKNMRKTQEFSIEELTQHPDIIVNLLIQGKDADISMYIRKEGAKVTISSQTYIEEETAFDQVVTEVVESKKIQALLEKVAQKHEVEN